MPSSSDAAYVVACLTVPVAWGVVVHLLFERFRRRRATPPPADSAGLPDDDIAPEYQI